MIRASAVSAFSCKSAVYSVALTAASPAARCSAAAQRGAAPALFLAVGTSEVTEVYELGGVAFANYEPMFCLEQHAQQGGVAFANGSMLAVAGGTSVEVVSLAT